METIRDILKPLSDILSITRLVDSISLFGIAMAFIGTAKLAVEDSQLYSKRAIKTQCWILGVSFLGFTASALFQGTIPSAGLVLAYFGVGTGLWCTALSIPKRDTPHRTILTKIIFWSGVAFMAFASIILLVTSQSFTIPYALLIVVAIAFWILWRISPEK